MSTKETAPAAERCIVILEMLQEKVLDGDPKAFGDGCSEETLRAAIEAWEATNALSAMFITVVRDTYGIPVRLDG